MVTNTTRAMWKRKNLTRQAMPQIQNLTMSLITMSIEDSLKGLLWEIREECIMAIKSKRNNQSYHCNNRATTPATATKTRFKTIQTT
jgi:transcription initiation factor IIE alpha subunit